MTRPAVPIETFDVIMVDELPLLHLQRSRPFKRPRPHDVPDAGERGQDKYRDVGGHGLMHRDDGEGLSNHHRQQGDPEMPLALQSLRRAQRRARRQKD